MRKHRLPLGRILLSFLCAAAALFGAHDLARADDPACQVAAVRGSATLEHAGSRAALVAGMALSAGDTITTAAGARVKLHFADGSAVRLGENAELSIVAVKIDAAAGTRTILLRLPIGLLRAAAAKFSNSSGSSFEIHTGIAYSAVRGTQWIVDADKVETNVYVQEGRVAVGADFETSQFPKLVEAGRWVHVTRHDGIGAVQESPPGTFDDLIDQTEASLAPSTPDQSVTDVASNVAAGNATDAVSNGTGTVAGVAGTAVNTATAAVSSVTGAVAGVAGAAVDTATAAVSNVTSAVAGVAGTAVDTATSAVATTTGAVTSTVNTAVSAVNNTTSAVTGALGVPGASNSSTGSSGGSSGTSSSGGSSSGGSSAGGSSSGGSSSGSSSSGGSSSGGSSSGGSSSDGSSGSGSSGSSSSGSSGSGSASGSNSGGKSLGGAVRDTLGKVGGLLK